MLWPLLFLTLLVGGLATYWPLRHGPTRIALYNALGNLLIVIFGTLAGNLVIAHAVDRWVGVPGFTRLVYQSIIIAALLSFLAITAETIHDWSRWRRALVSSFALLLVADGTWAIGHALVGPAWAHLCYNGFGASPWPLLVMNLAMSASFLAVAGHLMSAHVRFLRDPGRRLDRGLISWVLVLWSMNALEAIVILGQTALSLAGRDATALMPTLDNVAGLGLLIALGIVLHRPLGSLLSRGRYALYLLLEPEQRWVLRNLHAAYTLALRERSYLEGVRDSPWRRRITLQDMGQQARVVLARDHSPLVLARDHSPLVLARDHSPLAVSLLNRAGSAIGPIRRCRSRVSSVLGGGLVQMGREQRDVYVRYTGEREHLWRFANSVVLREVASLPLREGWPAHAIRSMTEAGVLLTAASYNGLSPAVEELTPTGDDDDAETLRRRDMEESIVVSDGYRIVMIVAGPHFYPDLHRQRERWGWQREAATVLTEILARHGAVARKHHDKEGAVPA